MKTLNFITLHHFSLTQKSEPQVQSMEPQATKDYSQTLMELAKLVSELPGTSDSFISSIFSHFELECDSDLMPVSSYFGSRCLLLQFQRSTDDEDVSQDGSHPESHLCLIWMIQIIRFKTLQLMIFRLRFWTVDGSRDKVNSFCM